MHPPQTKQHAETNHQPWNSPRWRGITRPYTQADVDRLKGTVYVEYSLARSGAEKFWKLLNSEPYIPALGAHRQPGRRDGAGRSQGDLPQRMAGRR